MIGNSDKSYVYWEKGYNKAFKLQNSKIYFLSICLIVIVVSIVQLSLVITGKIENTEIYKNSPIIGNLYLAELISIIITSIAAPCGIATTILLGKRDKKFAYYGISYFLLVSVNSLIIGLWYNMAIYLILIYFVIRTLLFWDKDDDKNDIISLSKKHNLILYLAIFLFILGFGTLNLFTIGNNPIALKNVFLIYFESSVFTFLFFGFLLLDRKYKQAIIMLLIANFLNAILMGMIGQWNLFATSVILLFNHILNFVKWEYLYLKQ